MFCRHEWELVDKEILPAAMELARPGYKIEGGMGLFRKKYILILKCKKCPKLKKFVEVNP